MSTNQTRSRWAAVGAAIAITLGAGGIGITHATTSSGEKPIYLPIEPCRLADTRPEFQVGPRSAPLGPDETYTLSGQGVVGNCNLKAGTTALSLNVTAINATAPTFVTLFPAGTDLPVASHLNPLPGQGPVPNAVNVDLNGAGQFSIYNLAGNVDIIIDVVGIYDTHDHSDQYLSAVVAPAAANPVIVRGQGATSVVRFTTGSFRVTFDRDVSDCAWVASYGQPDDDVVDAKWATVRGRDTPNEVGVVIRDMAGGQVDGNGFHLIAICP